jgi:hypothetical protein
MNVGTKYFGFRMRHHKFRGPCCEVAPSFKRGRRSDVRIIPKSPDMTSQSCVVMTQQLVLSAADYVRSGVM